MKRMIKASSLLAGTSFLEMIVRFARMKLVAVLLGTAGAGLISQLGVFFEMVRAWGSLGVRRAVIKQVGEARAAGEAGRLQYGQAVTTAFTLTAAVSSALALGIALLSKWISTQLFGVPDYWLYIVAMGFIVPAASFATLITSILKANLMFGPMARHAAGAYLALLLVTPALVYFFGYWGAVAAHAGLFVFPLASYLLLQGRQRYLRFAPRFSVPMAREQCSDGLNLLFQNSLDNFMKLLVAVWITRGQGLEAMGLYQVVITFTGLYLMLPIQSVSGYTVPVIAASNSNGEITKTVNESAWFLALILTPAVVFLMAWPEPFINLFYSKDFFAAAPVLQIQLVGIIFEVYCQSLGSALAAKGKYRALYALSAVHFVLFTLCAWLFFKRWGLEGVAVAFVISKAAVFVIIVFQLRQIFNFRMSAVNVKMLSGLIVWAGLALWMDLGVGGVPARAASLLLGVPWFYGVTTRAERLALAERVKRLVSKLRRRGSDGSSS